MTLLLPLNHAASVGTRVPPALARVGLLVCMTIAGTAGLWASGDASRDAVAAAGGELTYLLRAMAVLKALMASALVGAFLWRLAAPIGIFRFGAIAASCAAMAAGTTVIWAMAYVGLGALLLHAGLLTSALLLWFDPAVAARLGAFVATRRRSP